MGIFKNLNNINFSELNLEQPQTLKNNKYFSKILYNNITFQIQTPKSNLLYNGVTNDDYYLFTLILNNKELIEWLIKFEDKMLELLFENKDEWFEGDFNLNDFRSFYTKLLKFSDNKYTIKCKLLKNTYNIDSGYNIYDNQGNKQNIDDIKDNDVITILNFDGIILSNSSFQLSMSTKEILVLNNEIKQIKITEPKSLEESDLLSDSISEFDSDNDSLISDESYLNEDEESIGEKEYIGEKESMGEKDSMGETESIGEKNTDDNLEIIDIDSISDDDNDQLDYEEIQLKSSNDVYIDIYKQSKKKYKIAKKKALDAMIEMKKIRKTYLSEDFIDSSDDEII